MRERGCPDYAGCPDYTGCPDYAGCPDSKCPHLVVPLFTPVSL